MLIAGGGILGTFHAMEALERGFSVTQFEASAEPLSATARSPGALAFSRAAPGLELELCVDAAARWRRLAGEAGAPVRELGSLVAATDEREADQLEELCRRSDAVQRGWSLTRRAGHEPRGSLEQDVALGESVVATLHSDLDVVVETRKLLEHLRGRMQRTERYRFVGGVEIRDLGPGSFTDSTGRTHRGDLGLLCPGWRSDLAISMLRQPSVLRSVRIQVLQTGRLRATLHRPVSDVAALVHSGLGRATGMASPPPDPRLGQTTVALTCVQRRSRALTIGETRDHDEPFGFEVSQRPLQVLLERAGKLLGVDLPPVTHQWAGQVRQCTDGRLWLREDLDETMTLVGCADQRGIVLAPVIAAETLDWVTEGRGSGATHPGADGAGTG